MGWFSFIFLLCIIDFYLIFFLEALSHRNLIVTKIFYFSHNLGVLSFWMWEDLSCSTFLDSSGRLAEVPISWYTALLLILLKLTLNQKTPVWIYYNSNTLILLSYTMYPSICCTFTIVNIEFLNMGTSINQTLYLHINCVYCIKS